MVARILAGLAMTTLLTITFLYLPASLFFAALVSQKRDRTFLFQSTLAAWAVLLPLAVLVDSWMPYTDGGDDPAYYRLATMAVSSFKEALSLDRFVGMMEQPGYPWLLSITTQLTGPELLTLKLLNLLFFVMVGLTWYRIGCEIESRYFGRAVLVGVLAWVLLDERPELCQLNALRPVADGLLVRPTRRPYTPP
jgi:hypothetical protein